MDKVTNVVSNSPALKSLGTVVKVYVTKEGRMRVIRNPMPGVKLGLTPLHDDKVLLFEECNDKKYVMNVLGLCNQGSLDARTRECLRSYREATGIMINPLHTLPGRPPVEIPERIHNIFWAYHR